MEGRDRYKYRKYKYKNDLLRSGGGDSIPPGGECDTYENCVNYTISGHGCVYSILERLPKAVDTRVVLYFYTGKGDVCIYSDAPNICCNAPEICEHYTEGDRKYTERLVGSEEARYDEMLLWRKDRVWDGIVDCRRRSEGKDDFIVASLEGRGRLLSTCIADIKTWHSRHYEESVGINIHIFACRTGCS